MSSVMVIIECQPHRRDGGVSDRNWEQKLDMASMFFFTEGESIWVFSAGLGQQERSG